MSETYTGSTAGPIVTTVTIPSDGDDVDAASVDPVLQNLTDNSAYAKRVFPNLELGGDYQALTGALILGNTINVSRNLVADNSTAIICQGGNQGGYGLLAYGGFSGGSPNGTAINANGHGTGNAIIANGGANGVAIVAASGGGNNSAIEAAGSGTGAGIQATAGGSTDVAVEAIGCLQTTLTLGSGTPTVGGTYRDNTCKAKGSVRITSNGSGNPPSFALLDQFNITNITVGSPSAGHYTSFTVNFTTSMPSTAGYSVVASPYSSPASGPYSATYRTVAPAGAKSAGACNFAMFNSSDVLIDLDLVTGDFDFIVF